ncbi:MAG: hypothetical protein KGM43_03035 [Planctomycetota bacterium]|nr:hypothetical protein [Planctomycetota bacterium]
MNEPSVAGDRFSGTSEDAWATRLVYWRKRMPRIRIDAEPVAEQLARYRRVTDVLTLVSIGVSILFVALFTAFRRPDIGLILAAILFGPVIAISRLDFRNLRRNVENFERERLEFESRRAAE